MSIHKILCPLCFSGRVEPPLAAAVGLAKLTGAELVIVDSVYMPPVAFAGDSSWLPAGSVDALVDEKEVELGLAVRQCKRAGLDHVSAALLAGPPSAQVLAALGDDSYDLVVLGMHETIRHGRLSLGPSKRVFQDAPCSVLVSCPGQTIAKFRNVLCPIDFSERSLNALDLACELIAPDGHMTLVHVTEESLLDAVNPRSELAVEEEAAFKRLEQWAADLRARVPIAVTTISRIGRPTTEILDLFSSASFDLVVMGAHQNSGIRAKLFGSVATAIVRHATCPVLFAHPRDESTPSLRAIR